MKLILDTDPGVDDAIAILMALASGSTAPEGTLVPELVGLTTVGGNVPLARGTRNALALLEYTGLQHIPVARGNARPLRGSFPYSYDFHGKGGLSRRLPEPQARPSASGAIDFLAEQLLNNPGQIALVALGPLTNLARLQQSHPGVLEKARSLVVMGGAVNTAGNSTPHAEFNFYSDPLAAHRVVSSGAPLTLVDLGACRRVFIEREAGQNLKSGSRVGGLAAQLLRNWFRQRPGRERFEFYDPLALAAALDPAVLRTRPVSLEVETEDEEQNGASRITGEGGTVSIVEGVDRGQCLDLIGALLGLEGLGRG
jgi:inosine-uridine nucleoside N-ribohydrolase